MKAEDVWKKLHPIDLGIVTKEDAINFSKVIAELAFIAGANYMSDVNTSENLEINCMEEPDKETFINKLFKQ